MRVAGPGHTDVWCCGTGASWGQIAVAWARRRMGLAGWGSTRLIVNVTRASRLLRQTVLHCARRGVLRVLRVLRCPAYPLACLRTWPQDRLCKRLPRLRPGGNWRGPILVPLCHAAVALGCPAAMPPCRHMPLLSAP